MSAYSEAVAKAKERLGVSMPALDSLDPTAPGGADIHTTGGGDATAHQDFSEVIAHATEGVDQGEGYQPGGPPPGQQKTNPRTLGDDGMTETRKFAKVAGVSHGIVFGYGIVCKDENGEDYYDVQDDHIPEDSMLEAATDFAKGARPGKDMHAGPDVGQHVFLFPLTTDIAKALGIVTKKTGLLVGYAPPPDVLAKFKSGEYTGFSIGGTRIDDEEVS